MRALRLDDGGLVLARDVPVPIPGPDEALVRVRVAGICSTDLEMVAGYKAGFSGVLGHEFVGEIVELAGDATFGGGTLQVGARVVSEINIGCGRCDLCRRGLSKHCRSRQTIGIVNRDGVFADYAALPVANLHAIPDAVPDEHAVFVEPLAAALQVLEQVRIGPADRVAVVGDGRLGLLIAQVVSMTGCELTVFGRHADKLALLHRWGISNTALSTPDEEAGINDDRFDVVVEATGAASGFELSRRLVRPAGTIVLKSTFAGASPTFDLTNLVVDEVQVVGSRCGPFAPAIRLLHERRVHVGEMVQARYNLDDGLEAMQHAARRGVLKVLMTMQSDDSVVGNGAATG